MLRAVAFGSRLLPTRPVKDFHLQSSAHAGHTNYDRLLAVKNKYDPLPRMFHFEQGICTRADDAGTFLNGPPPVEFTAEPIVFEPHSDAE